MRSLGAPAVYYPGLSKVTSSISAMLLLSQIIHRPGDWVYISRPDLEGTGLRQGDIDEARRELIDRSLIDERLMGSPPLRHWRVNFEGLAGLLRASDENPRAEPFYAGTTPEKKARRQSAPVLVDDNARARLIRDFSDQLGAGETENQIDLALAHKAADNYNNKIIYVRRWLQREVDGRSVSRATPGRRMAAPGGPSGPAGGSQNGSGASRYEGWSAK